MANLATITTNILADSGIDDINVVVTTGSYTNPAWIVSLPWTKITGTPTTLAGYGITDAVTTNTAQTIIGEKTFRNSIILKNQAAGLNGLVLSSFSPDRLQIGGVTYFSEIIFAATSRSYTLPDASGTIALVGGAGVGTVTSVAALTIGTSGTDLSSSVANSTTTPVITLNVPTASASNRGALSAADWTTFNNKQNALTNPVTGTGTTNYLPKFTGASTIGNSIVQDNATGIIVNGTDNFTSQNGGWFFNGSGSYTSGIFASSSSNNLTLRAPQIITFESGGAQRMILNASGNLGLGVTPSAWNLYKAIQVQNASISNFDNSDNSIVGSNVFYGGSPNDFRYISTGTSTVYRLNNSVHSWFTAPLGTAGAAIPFTQAMTLGSNSGLSIGTPSAAPSQGLLVQGVANFNSAINGTSGLFSGNIQLFTGSFFRGSNTGGSAINLAGVGFDNNIYFGDDGVATNIRLGNSAGFVRVSSGGRILINTSTDNLANALQVAGSATFSSSVTANDFIQLNAVSGYASKLIFYRAGYNYWNVGTPSNSTAFAISESSDLSSPALFLKAGGNVGIGTTSPSYPLDIVGFANSSSGFRVTDGTIDNRVSWSSGNVGFFGTISNHPIALHTANTERMRITSAGNVGIGTTSPQRILELRQGEPFLRFNPTLVSAPYLIGAADGKLYFIPESTFVPTMTMQSGNVMIGTTTDAGFRLDVNGTGRFSGSASIPVTLTLTSANSNCDITMQSANSSSVSRIRNGTNDLQLHTNGSLALTLASNQAATFSSSVTVNGNNLTIQPTTTTTYALSVMQNAGGFLRVGRDTSTGALYGSDYAALLVSSGNYAMIIGTNDTERMRITSGGQIQYPNTGNNLSFVSYSSNQDRGITNFYQAQNFPSSNAYTRVFDITSCGDATGGGAIRFLTSAPNSAPSSSMLINTNGNVLIGTTTDNSNKLRVNGVGFFDQGIRTGNPYGSTTNNVLIGRFLTETASVDGSIRVQIGTRYYNIAAQDLGEVPS